MTIPLVRASTPRANQDALNEMSQKAMQALAEAVAKVVEDHRQRGKPLADWRNGQAVWMPVETAAVKAEAASATEDSSRQSVAETDPQK